MQSSKPPIGPTEHPLTGQFACLLNTPQDRPADTGVADDATASRPSPALRWAGNALLIGALAWWAGSLLRLLLTA